MVNALGLQTVAALALGRDPSALAQIGASIAGNGLMLAHGRSEENEADEFGVRYTSAAGYDPRGLVTFFEKLKAQQGHTPKALTWLSTHPATESRIAHINTMIAQNNLAGRGDLGANRLEPIN
jgi:beta-barrel assembly-enhancing protease